MALWRCMLSWLSTPLLPQLHGPLLESLHVSLVLESPALDTAFQMFLQCWAEKKDHLPQSTGNVLPHAAQEDVWLLLQGPISGSWSAWCPQWASGPLQSCCPAAWPLVMHLYISIWPTRRFTQCAHDISAAQFLHMRRIAQVILHCLIPSATPPPLLKTLCAAGAAHDKEYSGCSGLTWTKQGIFRSFSSIFFHYFSSIDELATHRNRSPAAVSQFTLLGFRSDHSYLIIDVQISEAWL